MTTNVLVEVYSLQGCSRSCSYYVKGRTCALCKDVREIIGRANADIPFEFKEVDISSSEDLFRRFRDDIPTVYINGKKSFKYKVDEAEFRKKVRKELIKAGMMRLWNKKHHYT